MVLTRAMAEANAKVEASKAEAKAKIEASKTVFEEKVKSRRRSESIWDYVCRTIDAQEQRKEGSVGVEQSDRDKDDASNSKLWSQDDFEYLETLGVGGMGTVVKAKEKESGYTVALKLMDTYQHAFWKRELEIHASLDDHPSIVNMYGHFFHPSRDPEDPTKRNEFRPIVYLILEYCPNGTLAELLESSNEGRLREKEASRFLSDVTDAMVYLHSKHIMHRDIKPRNILVSQEGKAKIADFGLSVSDPKSRRRTFAGTPSYMAPEIIKKDGKHYTAAVDAWSLGVTAYLMLTGEKPFPCEQCLGPEKVSSSCVFDDDNAQHEEASSDMPDIAKLCIEDKNYSPLASTKLCCWPSIEFPDFVSEDAQDLIRQLLHTDPEKRMPLEDVQNHPWIKKYTS